MADPTARFVLTASDQTGRAVSSAERNLRTVTRSAMQFRNVLAGFGVALSFRAIGGWVKDALQVQNLTAQQAKDLRESRAAMAGLNVEFQNLARTASTELAPAIEHAAKWWREFLFPTEAEAAQDRLGELSERALTLSRTLVELQQKDPFISPEAIARVRAEIEGLQKEMGVLQGVVDKPLKPGNLLDGLSEISTSGFGLPAEMRRDFDFAAASAAVLNSELKEISGAIPKMPEDLKKLSPEFNNAVASLRQYNDELSESAKFAQSLGEDFRQAFAGWILGAERSFSDLLERMAVEMATSALFKGFASLFPGGSFFASFFGGARANGGPVSSGKAYLVGERGPELFMPGQSGMIAANAGGPSMHFETHIDARGADPSLANRLPKILADNNQRLKAEIRHELGRGR